MTDDEYAAQKARLEALAEAWIKPLGLGYWSISTEYVRDGFEVDGAAAPNTVGNCKADWRYMHARLAYNMLQVANQDDEDLEHIYVHELMHIFLNEFRAFRPDDQLTAERDDWLAHEERAASMLAKAFIWKRDLTRDEMARSEAGQ